MEQMGISPTVESSIQGFSEKSTNSSIKSHESVVETKAGTAPRPPKKSKSSTSDDNGWDELLKRAQIALGMKTKPRTSEQTIQFMFERLVSKLETINAQKNSYIPKEPEK